MRLTITFEDDSTITIEAVQAIRVVDAMTLETNTWGNGPVLQRRVKRFVAEYSALAAERPTDLGTPFAVCATMRDGGTVRATVYGDGATYRDRLADATVQAKAMFVG